MAQLQIAMPEPGPHGWGQVARFLVPELHKLGPLPGPRSVALQCIVGQEMRPLQPDLRADVTAGYCFFEWNEFVKAHPANLARWDWIFAGSSWCEQELRAAGRSGYTRCSTIVQGVDQAVFHPDPAVRPKAMQFSIFSGGKFEYRKGQDVVLAAFRQFAKGHPDAHLYACWWNAWPEGMADMACSPHLRYRQRPGGYAPNIRRALEASGVPLERVHIQMEPLPSAAIADVMRQCDLAVFPNRCEGGTNLVLMEAMACGVPCVASSWTGHSDLATWLTGNIRPARNLTVAHPDGTVLATWQEPCVESLVEQMEQAYQDRAGSAADGLRAAAQTREWFTWERAAKQMHDTLSKLSKTPEGSEGKGNA